MFETGRYSLTNSTFAIFMTMAPIYLLSRLLLLVVSVATLALGSSTAASASSPTTTTTTRPIVIGIDGGTESIRACCFDANTGNVIGTSCAVPYKTFHPQPGWAEQSPHDWYDNLCLAVRGALSSCKDTNTDDDYDEDDDI